MKLLIPTLLLSFLSIQPRHVSWSFSPIMVQPGIYTVHAQAFIDKGWIIFAQHQKKEEQYKATHFTFDPNPLIKIMKVDGGGVVYQDSCYRAYESYADFEIKVVVKNRGEAVLRGYVSYEPYKTDGTEDKWIRKEPFEIKLD